MINDLAKSRAKSFPKLFALGRFGLVMLTIFVVCYLAIITYAILDQLGSMKSAIILAFLWCVGLLALALLARMWRDLSLDKRGSDRAQLPPTADMGG
jgi:hypothetical protein